MSGLSGFYDRREALGNQDAQFGVKVSSLVICANAICTALWRPFGTPVGLQTSTSKNVKGCKRLVGPPGFEPGTSCTPSAFASVDHCGLALPNLPHSKQLPLVLSPTSTFVHNRNYRDKRGSSVTINVTKFTQASVMPMAHASLPPADNDGANLHPVRQELILIAARLIEQAAEVFNKAVAVSAPGAEENATHLLKQFVEVSTWLYGELTPSPEQLVADLQRNVNEGWSPADALIWMKAGRKRLRGRPATLRPAAVIAAELRLANRSLSWPAVAKQVCNGKDCTHGRACYEKLRREVVILQALLKRHRSALVIARPA